MNMTFDSLAPMLAYMQKVEHKQIADYLKSLEARPSTYGQLGRKQARFYVVRRHRCSDFSGTHFSRSGRLVA